MTIGYADKTLTCRDCTAEFVFSAGEQEFYASRGLMNEPTRCPACRSVRKAQRQAIADGAPREMHEVTCAECGGVARVPFLPRNDKPVYCSACFEHIRPVQN